MRSLTVLVLVAALYIAAGPVFVSRAVADDLDTCAAVAGEEAIAACTRAISSGRLHDHDLAAEYYNRGIKYSSKGGLRPRHRRLHRGDQARSHVRPCLLQSRICKTS
jgi:hypothetical protein